MTTIDRAQYAVRLPWPPAGLSPNARLHWRPKAKLVAKARNDARLACLAAGARGLGWGSAAVDITFHAPDARRRDLDNMLARTKSALDGIADAAGVDDAKWSLSLNRGEPVKGGAVVVTLSRPSAERGQG